MTTPSGGLVGDATIRIRADTDPAILALNGLVRTADGRLRDLRGRFVSESRLIVGPQGLGGITTATNQIRTATTQATSDSDSALRRIGSFATGAVSALAGIAAPLASIGAAAGSVVPLLAGVAAAAANIAPAAAGAATGFLAIRQAQAVVQLGMVGVEDAISAAFETGEGSAEAFAESLEGLSPSARNFALAVRDSRDALVGFQQSIQEELFTELDSVFTNTAESVLPVLQDNLLTTANILGNMGTQTANAASELAEDGTLGRALIGANQGLLNLEGIPARIITAFFQLAAAGAPAFTRITDAAQRATESITDSLSRAFESGALEDAVITAVDLLSELGGIATSAFGVVQNVLGAVSVEGGDLFQVLGTILGALEEFTGTSAFQDALGALAETMGVLASTAAPLLISALEAIAPIFSNLAGPVQTVISNLGQGLSPIIEALAPILDIASQAIGELVSALAPILPVIGNLIAQLGPVLTPIIQTFAGFAQMLAPLLVNVVNILAGSLQPVLAVLPQVIQPILDALSQLVVAIFPLLNALVAAFTPIIDQQSDAFLDLLVALEPVITSLLILATEVLVALTPLLIPLIGLIVQLTTVFNRQLVATINNIVIPALNAVAALLRGDFSGALNGALGVLRGFISTAVNLFREFPGRVFSALASLGSLLVRQIVNATRSMGNAIGNGISSAVRTIRALPRLAAVALSGIGSVLFNAGRALIQGFINGIRSLASAALGVVGDIIGSVGGLFPGSPAEEGPFSGQGYVLLRGQRLSQDFATGIADNQRDVERASRQLVTSASVALTPSGAPLPVGAMPTTLAPVPGTPVTIEITLVNQGVLGSRVEVLDWLTGALDELRRQQRLGVTL